jgi:glycosyltransferase involved in cell wall biosynthesis
LDARLLRYRRGMGNYAHALLAGLSGLDADVEYTIYLDDCDAAKHVPADPRFRLRILAPRLYPIWEQVALPREVFRNRIDVLHCLFNTAPLALPRSNVRLIVTVHDVMYMLPEAVLPRSRTLYHMAGRQYRAAVVPRVARNAAKVITISEFSKRDVVRLLEVDNEQVHVIPLAAGWERLRNDEHALDRIRLKYGTGSRFALALGALDPRKNTKRIIAAYAQAKERGAADYTLVVVGLPKGSVRSMTEVIQAFGVGQSVVVADYVPMEDLSMLMSAAEVLIYPSLYEGFGLPIVEAQSCGTCVIASDRGSCPEVMGDGGLLVDPLDVQSIASAIEAIASDPSLREVLIARGRANATRFSRAKTAAMTLDLYKAAFGTPCRG